DQATPSSHISLTKPHRIPVPTATTTLPQPLPRPPPAMISDAQLYSLAIFLGSAAMLMIVLYHFLEINAKDAAPLSEERKADALPAKAR
ncbi:hypothetical protein LTR28_009081, partial [Elasticomyces elasticus]